MHFAMASALVFSVAGEPREHQIFSVAWWPTSRRNLRSQSMRLMAINRQDSSCS